MINKLRLGYPCINNKLAAEDIKTNHACRYETIKVKGIEYVKSLAISNIEALYKVLEWNVKHNIRLYRIYSDIFPHAANTNTEDFMYDFKFIEPLMQKCGEFAVQYKIRLSIHATEYCHLNSENPVTVTKTSKELRYYTEIFNLLFKHLGKDWYRKLPAECKPLIILHVGTVKPSKAEAIGRWIENYKKLPTQTQQLIVVENDEFSYSPQDILPAICIPHNIPLIFDIFHFSINYGIHVMHATKKEMCELKINELQKIMPEILETWYKRNLIPKFHLSEQQENARVGTHGDTLKTIPEFFLNACKSIQIDVMLETKNKEQTLLKLVKKFNH
jgi:UV DNA damage endonuclease